MIEHIIYAFTETHDGCAADRVVADPELNARFIEACRHHGSQAAPLDLNWALLNIRKKGGRLPKTTRRTTFRDEADYAFASEMAIRSIELKYQTTLDRVLCDPERAVEFDGVATMIAPGYTPLQYRWAALCLRKTNRLKPELLSRVILPELHGPFAVNDVDPLQFPNEQGVYVLSSREKVLYVGEAINLRVRLRKHLDHSDNKRLARYIWECGTDDLLLEYQVLPRKTRTAVRKALELELIRSRRAEFNVQR